MPAPDDRLPVIVGVSRLTPRVTDAAAAPTPLDTLEHVVRAAADDAGPRALAAVDTVTTLLTAFWNETDPGAAVAQRLGLAPRRTVVVGNGGEVGVRALNWLADEILAGRVGTAVLAATHNWRTHELAAKQGVTLDWPVRADAGGEPERVLTTEKKATHPDEDRAGLTLPIHLYPVVENALRHAHGLGIGEHRLGLGRLFAPFTEAAARNPYAWFPVARTPEELITPTPQNRMICFPYTKMLNSLLSLDQAAAIVVTSRGEARRLGIAEERWVHWWGGGYESEPAYCVVTRPDLATSTSMVDSHRTALANAGVGVDDVAAFDLYSCFPAAVAVASDVLGLAHDDPRGLTVTGGLPYAGGPGSGYTLHSLAGTTELLRERPGDIAMVTGNGMYVSKHSATLLSTAPPRAERPTAAPLATAPSAGLAVDPLPVDRRDGRGTVDSYTIVHGRDGGPERGVVVGRYDDGVRFVAVLPADAGTLVGWERSEPIGTTGDVRVVGDDLRFEPR